MAYKEEYEASIADPAAFWGEKADALDWYKAPETVLSTDEHGIYRWFADGELNEASLKELAKQLGQLAQ